MTGDRDASLFTDQETAPLLQGSDDERDGDGDTSQFSHRLQSLSDRITSTVQEPLTSLTKVLLVVALILLLLSSIFIGLYAGAQYNLNLERRRHHGGDAPEESQPPETVTVTHIATETSVFTSTSTSTEAAPTPTAPPEEPVCLTSQCIVLSAAILSSIDDTQDPCENFYDFANGGWLNSHPLPADKGSFGNFDLLSQANQQVIRKILESNTLMPSVTPSYDEEILRKLRALYSSCMNETALDEIGEEPLLHFVRTVRKLYRGETTDINSVSAKDEEGKDRDGLTAAIAFLHSRGINTLFELDVEGDVGVDPNHMVLWFSQPNFGLPSKEYFQEELIRDLYQNVIEQLLLIIGDTPKDSSVIKPPVLLDGTGGRNNFWPPWPWPPWGDDDDKDEDEDTRSPEERAHDLAEQIVKFESRIANASLDLDILYQDPVATYNPLPISNLTDALPDIHFPNYFSSFTPWTFPEQVIMTYPAFPASLSKILNDTASDVVEGYLVIYAALRLAPLLGLKTEAWKAVRILDETLGGIKKGAVGDRAEYCVAKVENALGFAAGRYFVNETFGGESREKGTRVITDIIGAFKSSLSHIEWMDKESAKAAAEKADAIRVKVGFPLSPDTQDARSIANYYRLVEIDENHFFENMLSASTSVEVKKWSKLGQKRNPLSFEMYPSMVNAYFNPPANEIVFPAGILQPPFFSEAWPAYLSYGAFGQVAAHELTHAFDSAGRMYNQQGKLEQWWSNFTSEGFQDRQDCIVKQYSAYTVDDGKGGVVHVNGNLTSGENIGDSGLIQAYRAWKAQYDKSLKADNEYLLPGLKYTREQLFFIAFGRIWGSSIKPASAVKRVRTDPHSPNRYRVDGTVSNIPEFAKAFNCSSHAKLNPPSEKRCIFW